MKFTKAQIVQMFELAIRHGCELSIAELKKIGYEIEIDMDAIEESKKSIKQAVDDVINKRIKIKGFPVGTIKSFLIELKERYESKEKTNCISKNVSIIYKEALFKKE